MPDLPDAAYPAAPYPGAVPDRSFVHVPGGGLALTPRRTLAGTDLDDWLVARGEPRLADRVPVLAYGSNRNPAKIGRLRRDLGLTGAVVVLRARTTGLAAVWAHGLRVVDDQRPAVLAAAPGVVEEHSVWFATPGQVAVLDRCEGRHSGRYRLARLHSGEVRTEDGAVLDGVLAYLGAAEIRRPLLVDGAPVRCAVVPQAAARALDGDPAPSDGLSATTLTGAPDPAAWPDRLFVYGTLQPGERSWHRLTATGTEPATVPGTLLDTGRGFPAVVRGEADVPGTVVTLRDPAAQFPALDAFEGPEYCRTRITLPDGRPCWTYVWIAPTTGFRHIASWANRSTPTPGPGQTAGP